MMTEFRFFCALVFVGTLCGHLSNAHAFETDLLLSKNGREIEIKSIKIEFEKPDVLTALSSDTAVFCVATLTVTPEKTVSELGNFNFKSEIEVKEVGKTMRFFNKIRATIDQDLDELSPEENRKVIEERIPKALEKIDFKSSESFVFETKLSKGKKEEGSNAIVFKVKFHLPTSIEKKTGFLYHIVLKDEKKTKIENDPLALFQVGKEARQSSSDLTWIKYKLYELGLIDKDTLFGK